MDFGALPPEVQLRPRVYRPGCGSTRAAAPAWDGLAAHEDVNPAPVRPLGPTLMADGFRSARTAFALTRAN